jgi:hypothetical protein
VVAEFDGSPSIGPWTVYPKVKDFAIAQKILLQQDVFEIYTVNNMAVHTEYLFALKP